MPGWFDRVRGFIDRFNQSIGRSRESAERPIQHVSQPPEPPPPPPEEELPPEYYQEPSPVDEYSEDCNIQYMPGRIEGRHVRVFPRWYVESPPDLDCIRSLLNAATAREYVTIIICGTPCSEYRGKEGESTICLSYRQIWSEVIQYANVYYVHTVEDWANEVNYFFAQEGKLDCWESVSSVGILDKD